MIEGVLSTSLSIIDTEGGDVLHAMKSSDPGYRGFGEAYFSTVDAGAVKGWKRHHEMTLNLIVPVGMVRFVLYDDREKSATYGRSQDLVLSRDNYCRLTVPPLLWMGFQGLGKKNSILLNIASVPHSPDEVDRKEIDQIPFEW